MNEPDIEDVEILASILEAHEARLAAGSLAAPNHDPAESSIPPHMHARVEAAKECVSLLARLWPEPNAIGFATPTWVGRFKIIRQLGLGGFGIVYEAYDETLRRHIALKVQRPEAMISPGLRRRFQREASAAARLRHPNICTVYEVGQTGLQIWIATELSLCGSLADWLRSKHAPAPPRAAAKFIAALADALAYSHEQGVLHRDLKPSNVLLELADASNSEQNSLDEYSPKVIDFGLAKSDEDAEQDTRSGTRVGTPDYMAPEQATGQLEKIGPSTDIYALGAILYEMLVGRPPLHGETELVTLRQIVEVEPARLRSLRPAIPRDLEAICLKCLEKRPERRYLRANALASDLRCFLNNQPTVARPQTSIERLAKAVRMHPTLTALVVLSVFGSLAFLAQAWNYIGQLKSARELAEASQRQADAARIKAEVAADEAQASEEVANKLARSNSQFLYASRMRSAYQWLSSGDTDQVAELLEPYNANEEWAHLRGFEWFYLKRCLHVERLTLRGHQGEVYGLTFSPNGRVLATGAEDGAIKLWEPVSGRELASIPAHKSCVNSLAFAPDGTMLASCSCDHTIKLWDTSTLKLLATLDGHPNVVECVAFSPTADSRLASCGRDPFVRVWDLQTQEIVQTLDTHRAGAYALRWQGDAKTIFVATATLPTDSQGPAVLTWDVEKDQAVPQRWDARCVATTQLGSNAYIGLRNGTVRLLRGATASPLTLKGFLDAVQSLAVSPQGDFVAAGGNDRTIRIWNVVRGERVHLLAGHTGRVQSLEFSPDGTQLASASFDGTIKLWDRRSFTNSPLSLELFVHNLCRERHSIALSSDFRYAAVLSSHDQASVYDLSDESLVGTLAVSAPSAGISFVADQSVLFGLPLDTPDTVTEWDVAHWKPGKSYPQDVSQLGDILLASGGRYLATATQGSAKILSTQSGQTVRKLDKVNQDPRSSKVPQLFLSPDGETLGVSLEDDDPSWLIDLDRVSARATASSLRAVANNGQLIATRDDDYSVTLLDPLNSKPPIRLRQSDVTEVVFSPDGKNVAIGGVDGAVSLYDVATGQKMVQFSDLKAEIRYLRFSADGRKLAAAGFSDGKPYSDVVENNDATAIAGGTRYTVKLHVWDASDQDDRRQ